jgi:hypothetical protein
VQLKRVYSKIALEAVGKPLLGRVLALWAAKKGERPFPAREELSPRELVRALPYLTLSEVLDGGTDFRLRIIGEEVLAAYGHHLKGQKLTSLVDEIGSTMLEAYRDVVRDRAPLLLRGWFEHGEHQLFQREVLIMPLGHATVDHVLAAGALLPGTGLRAVQDGWGIADLAAVG